MSRPTRSISKEPAVSPRERSTAAITAKQLFSSKVPFLPRREHEGRGKDISGSHRRSCFIHGCGRGPSNSRISILDRCLNPCVILDILGSFSRVTSIIYQQLDWASVPHLVNMPSAKTMACSWRIKVYCPTFPATVMHWQHYFIQLVLYYDVPVKKTLNYALFSLWTIRHCLVWLLIAWSWRKVFNI